MRTTRDHDREGDADPDGQAGGRADRDLDHLAGLAKIQAEQRQQHEADDLEQPAAARTDGGRPPDRIGGAGARTGNR